MPIPDLCSAGINFSPSIRPPHSPSSAGSLHRFGHLPHDEMGKEESGLNLFQKEDNCEMLRSLNRISGLKNYRDVVLQRRCMQRLCNESCKSLNPRNHVQRFIIFQSILHLLPSPSHGEGGPLAVDGEKVFSLA